MLNSVTRAVVGGEAGLFRIVIFETPGAKLFSFPIGIKYSFLNILLD
jgi:hypothetical protein